MTTNTEYPNGCSEEYAELCALSTTGELNSEELAMLNEHVAGCAACASLLREYSGLAFIGMARLAANYHSEPALIEPLSYKKAKAKARPTFRAPQPIRKSRLRSDHNQAVSNRHWQEMKRRAILIGTAALVLVCLGGAFEAGRRMTAISSPIAVTTVANSSVVQDGERLRFMAELAAAQVSLRAATEKAAGVEKQLAALSAAKTSLSAQVEELTRKDSADSGLLAAVTQQRDSLQQQLTEASNVLARAREDLNHAQRERQGALSQVVSLESEVQDLHAELVSASNSTEGSEKFLTVDRDIRELMGARQLYIADVFDVKNDGTRSKPFGRVFYTKGRSLIFYAFDLEKQPGYRETKTFQAWGKPDGSSAKPISIGVFYMDNEQNRRWVVKSDKPELLAQINSVFVTVEPHGGSQRPTGKPFLLAYLHTLQPNHP